MDKVIKYIETNFKIIKVYDNKHVYKIHINNDDYIIHIVDIKVHPWISEPSFDIMDSNKYIERTINNYRLCSKLNIGPKLYQTLNVYGYELMLLEYLPHNITEYIIENYSDQIKIFISNIHKLGIYHGDLHSSNIAMDKNMKFKLLDFETMFFNDEINIESNISYNPIIKEWIENGFSNNMTIKQFIEYEANKNWTILG